MFGKLGDEYYREQFKPWIDNYIKHYGYDPSKGFDNLYAQARETLLKGGYEAAVQYVQSFDKEKLEAFAKGSQKTGLIMMIGGGILVASAFFFLRK